jgi:3-dehydroquinate synthase
MEGKRENDHSTVRIEVSAAAETGGPYPVLIRSGLLGELASLLRAHVRVHRWAIITDDIVEGLHGRTVADGIAGLGPAPLLISFPHGEASKTRELWGRLTDLMLESGIGRDGGVVALGGGVVGDLAGFVAATYMRGIPCVQVPTTTLAMIDAAVGGKTGVDLPAGKNLVGVMRQPRLVIMDPAVLGSLPDDVHRAGLAEAVKHAAVADEDYLAWIEREVDVILRRDPRALQALIRRSVEIKASLVAEDTLETGPRASLNFGHTIAHALEHVSGFAIAHGYAVAIGMVAEARLGEALGIAMAGTAARIERLLTRLGLPVHIPPATALAEVIAATRADKKSRAAHVRYALLERPGRAARSPDGQWTFAVSPAEALAAITGEASS